ncbi:MAG: hypothetical protein ACM3RP_09140 [Chitinophagales bacterium]
MLLYGILWAAGTGSVLVVLALLALHGGLMPELIVAWLFGLMLCEFVVLMPVQTYMWHYVISEPYYSGGRSCGGSCASPSAAGRG